MQLELYPATKIFEKLRGLNKKMFLVGFKAEHNVSEKELIARSFDILKKADADIVVANDVGKTGRGFNVDTNEVFVVDRSGNARRIALSDKRIVADRLLDIIIGHMK